MIDLGTAITWPNHAGWVLVLCDIEFDLGAFFLIENVVEIGSRASRSVGFCVGFHRSAKFGSF